MTDKKPLQLIITGAQPSPGWQMSSPAALPITPPDPMRGHDPWAYWHHVHDRDSDILHRDGTPDLPEDE